MAVNELPPDAVLTDQMITVGYDNASISITNPRELEISRIKRTVAGSAYWRNDINGNVFIDDQAYDYNLQYGEYKIVVRPNISSPSGTTFSVGIGIDGSQQAVMVQDAGWFDMLEEGRYRPIESTDSIVLYYDMAPISPIQPPNGVPWHTRRPVFDWSNALARTPFAVSYQFQLSPYYDFRALRIDTSGLPTPTFQPRILLGQDSVFYWRFRVFDGITYTAYSHAYAAYVSGCCQGLGGNVDCDPADVADISDITTLIDNLFITFTPLCCPSEANVDGSSDGNVDISDLTTLIDYLYITFTPPAACL
jgi:hypothetical protein